MIPFKREKLVLIGILLFYFASKFYQTPENIITLTQFFNTSYINYFIVFSLLIVAISSGVYIVPLYAIMQHNSESKYLSRIVAANNVLNALLMVISSIFIALLIKFNLDLLQIFLIVGILNCFIFFFTYQNKYAKII